MSASTPPDPAEQLARQIASLNASLNNLQSQVLLSSVKDQLEDLDTTVNGLAGRVSALRTAGYVFEVELDKQARALKQQWPSLRSRAEAQVAAQAPQLQAALRPLESQARTIEARQANVASARPLAAQLENAVGSLEAKVRAAEIAVRGAYDSFQTEAQSFASRLDRIEWTMQQVAEASFSLLPAEGAIAAVEAKWDRDGKDDPKGVLFLTDQRLFFEQKEEVATKKVLFITTAKEKVQKLLLEAALASVEQVKPSKKGLLGHEDHLDVGFTLDGPVRAAHFHIDG